MPKRYKLNVLADADTSAIRHETHMDRDHLVVPIVALCEGVLHPSNAPQPELALASEFGKHPQGWNGRPVVLDHPKDITGPVSANSPANWEEGVFGMLFNTTINEDKLKTEAWIDMEKVSALSVDIQDAVSRLESGEMSEVSTGLFMTLEDRGGVHNNEEFRGVWRDVVPDHLAILPEGMRGACSVDDGAGAPRVNAERISEEEIKREEPTEVGMFQRLMQKFGGIMSFRSASNTLSDGDTRTALNIALQATDPDKYFWVMAVFDDHLVYEEGFGTTLFERTYEISDDGMVTLSDEVQQVRPVTTFVPVTVASQEENPMAVNKEKVDALIALTGNAFTEDDRTYLEGLEEDRFTQFETLSAEPVVEPVLEPVQATPIEEPVVAPVVNAEAEPTTPEAFIQSAPPEVQEVLNSGLRIHREHKQELIKSLTANSNCDFTEEQLNGKGLDELTSLAKLANVETFVPGGAPRVNTGEDDQSIPAPVALFPAKQAS